MAVESINPIMKAYNSGTVNAAESAVNSEQKTGAKKNKSELGIEDFFTLMAAQLKNQSMHDQVDNTQFLAQMAQFSALSQMSALNNSTQTNFAVALIGKNVSISTIDSTGAEQIKIGQVEQVSFFDKVPHVLVDGSYYTVDDIMDIG